MLFISLLKIYSQRFQLPSVMKRIHRFFLLLVFCPVFSYSQLSVSGGFSAQQLAEMLAGPNITVFNATLTTASGASGKFTGGGATNLGVSSGVLLTSGNISAAPGPNFSSGTTTVNGTPGDALLTNISGVQTYDATVLEFQFQVQSESVEFNYVFASEEYNEFVGSSFNDVFGFFISGPGISGQENIALVPNTTTTVSINNINLNSYWQYYIDNVNGNTIGYDGFTTKLTAKKTGLTPCQTYTLRLAIADAGDGAYDSGVFLQENSLIQGTVSAISNTIKADSVSLEGCTRASFTFYLDAPKLTNTEIKFQIAGSATNAVDYKYIDSIFTIPAGQTSATIFIDPLNDGITEGREVVKLIYSPQPCAQPDTVLLYIDDTQPLNFSLSGIDPSCGGSSDGQININATGGFPAYTYTIVGGQTYTSSPITNVPEGTYTIRVDDSYGCKADAVTIGSVFDAGATFLPDGNGQSYTSSINISGFSAGQTLTDINQLQSICAELEHSSCGEVKIELIAPDGTTILLKQTGPAGTTDLGEPVAKAPTDGGNSDITPGNGYDYCWTTTPTYGTMMNEVKKYKHTYVDNTGKTLTDNYLPAGSYQSYQSLTGLVGVPLNGTWTMKVTDTNPQDNGYIFEWGISLKAGMPDSTITLIAPPKPTFTTSTSSAITQPTCGNNNGAIDISVSGTAGPYSYLWSTGATTEDISGLAAGSYTLTVTDNTSCTYDTSFLVTNVSTMVLSTTQNNISCPGLNDGNINLTATGGTPSYLYSWDSGQTTEDLSNLSPGTYTATVTDQNGCKALISATIIEIPPVKIQSSITNETCGNENGIIDLTVTAGSPPYTYTWNTGTTSEDANYLQAGTYSVTVKDSKNCSASKSFTLVNEVANCVINCDLIISDFQKTDETCGMSNGSINITTAQGTQPYTYQWSNNSTFEDISSVTAGTYSVTVTDVNGCEATQSFVINNNTGTLSMGSAVITNETCGNGQGAINISVSGGALPYSFLWSNGATTEDISSVKAGSYSVTVTDANSCAMSYTYSVINNSGTLTQTYGNAMDEVCGNSKGSIDITVSGGQGSLNYIWSNGSTSQDLINISAGNYFCTITDGSGCKITTPTYTVNNNAGTLYIFDIDVSNEVCDNNKGRINVDPSGGLSPYTYLWNTGATTQSISNLTEGNYSCTVTDNIGCSVNTGQITVLNSSGTLSLNSVTVTDESCSNNLGSIDVFVSGGGAPYSYLWNTGAITEDLFNLAAGTYTCTVTDTSGCIVTVNASLINNSGTLNIDNAVITNEACGDQTGAIDLFLSGGTTPLTYTWNTGANTQDINALNAGTYTCTITDAAGCEANGAYQVQNISGTLSLAVPVITNEICSNASGSIDITVSGGSPSYTYLWNNGTTIEDLTNLTAGNYSCEITDAAGCKINTGDITINNTSPGLSVSLTSLTNETCGNQLGAINISVSGGTSPYTFLWSTGASTEDITGLNAATYTVTVTTAGGCSITKSYTITNSSGTLALTGNIITNENCNNDQGAIDLTISGGSVPYTFAWSNGALTEDISGLSQGTYSCIITDNSGCSINTGNLTVNNSSGTLSLLDVFVTNEQCSDSSGKIDITVTGGTAPITYLWNNGSNTQDIIDLPAGSYSCLITDNSGCTLTASGIIQNTAGTLDFSGEIITNTTCGNNNGAIDLTVTGNSGPVTYLWSNGATTQNISGLAAANYTCTITDSTGCSASKTFQVNASLNDITVLGVNVTDEICNNNQGAIDITLSGGLSPLTYSWSNGASTEDISSLNSGTYNCTITDAAGCTKTVSATVSNSSGTLAATESIVNATCGNNNGSINLTVTGGSLSYNYSWNTGSTSQDIFNLAPGTYTCTISDFTGCFITYSAVVTGTTAILVSNILKTDELCGDSGGAIDLTVSGGTQPYTYGWSSGQTTQDITGLSAGTYSCNINDAGGCFKTVSITLSNSPGSLAQTDSVTNAVCGDSTGAINLTVTGGAVPYSFSWSNGSLNEDLSGIPAGSYTCSITDFNGCNINKTFQVSGFVNNLAVANVTSVPEVCGNGKGSLTVNMSGGSLPYSYQWNTGGNSQTLSNLTSGTYSCTISDGDGCSQSLFAAVNNTTNDLEISNVAVTPDACSSQTGAINITVSGGDVPYTYLWNTGQVTQDISGIPAGLYNCTVTDFNGCSVIIYASVDNAAPFQVSDTLITLPSCGTCTDGAIDITLSSNAVLPVSYTWSNGEITEDITGLAYGLYYVTITDANGCSLTSVFNLNLSTGINNLDANENFVIYPNPASEILNIQWRNPLSSEVLIKITDVLGKIIYTEVYSNTGVQSKLIDVNHLDNGTYFLLIKENNKISAAKFLLIK